MAAIGQGRQSDFTMKRRDWTRDELLVAFNFYCCTPFGRYHSRNPDIIRLAEKIGRTPSALAMKLGNLASFDPVHQARGVKGFSNTASADGEIWKEFNANAEELAVQSQEAFNRIVLGEVVPEVEARELTIPTGPTEATRTVRTRLVQGFFREAVLSSYDFRCAVCEMNLAELLNASHIIPWGKNIERRADPRNGLSLCALHDRAFDRGLIGFDEGLRVLISQRLKDEADKASRVQRVALLEIESKPLFMPKRFAPDPDALKFHRENIFKG